MISIEKCCLKYVIQTQDEEASEEMVQDIFVSLWKRWDEVVINSSLEGYLIRSAKQKVIDYYREKYSVKQTICQTARIRFTKTCTSIGDRK
ncbi:MAG: sigma factor [Bacteroidota bacterium]